MRSLKSLYDDIGIEESDVDNPWLGLVIHIKKADRPLNDDIRHETIEELI